jgi:hypothetical protein
VTAITVDFRTDRAAAMFERIGRNVSRREVNKLIAQAGEVGARTVTGIPTGATGDLAASVRSKMLANVAFIVADAERPNPGGAGVRYARFVFARQRPSINTGAIADVLTRGILELIERA